MKYIACLLLSLVFFSCTKNEPKDQSFTHELEEQEAERQKALASAPDDGLSGHVTCYSGGTRTYDISLSDGMWQFQEKATQDSIQVTGDCLVRSKASQ